MPLDPWSYAAKTHTEHAEQVALFMWANMAMRFGTYVAGDPFSYTQKGYAQSLFERTNPNVPIPQLKWLHAIHNQGHGDKIRGGNAKAEGVKAGVADVFLPVPMPRHTNGIFNPNIGGCGLYIELKKANAGAPSELQLEFQSDMRAAGYKAEIIHGWELAKDEILSYLGCS